MKELGNGVECQIFGMLKKGDFFLSCLFGDQSDLDQVSFNSVIVEVFSGNKNMNAIAWVRLVLVTDLVADAERLARYDLLQRY